MKEQLLKLLGLRAEATEEQIVEAVKALTKSKFKSIAARMLGLVPDATEDTILDTLEELKKSKVPTLARPTDADKRDVAIRKKMAASGGALNYEQAAMALDHQAEADKKRKGNQ